MKVLTEKLIDAVQFAAALVLIIGGTALVGYFWVLGLAVLFGMKNAIIIIILLVASFLALLAGRLIYTKKRGL